VELLAPAGTYNCVLAAVNSGADAVYFAGQEFGARSFAGNLSSEEIFRATDFCHLRGVRVFVTVNTLVYDKEYKELENFVKILTKAGVDAVIVQDLGILKFIRELSPDIELHGSTQMTIHSKDGAEELESLGVSRVVLSRELSKADITKITKETSIETEVFVHGAMCMSYSGQCLMSSVIGGRSGNRGKCAQPCRLPYSTDGEKEKFYLSLKDMSLAEHIAELKEIGVNSLKIEGRMKGEAYVSEVVSAYRRLIDEHRLPTPEEKERLNRIFFRGGLTDGYFTGKTGTDMFAFDKPDNPYLKTREESAAPTERRRSAELAAVFKEGEKPYISMKSGNDFAEVWGEHEIERAGNRPATQESVRAQLLKTGGTAFEVTKAEIELKGAPFVPVSVINDLRRRCIAKLEDSILEKYRGKSLNSAPEIIKEKRNVVSGFTCSVLNMEQYRAVLGYDFCRIYIPINIIEENAEELFENREKIVISLPVIIRDAVRKEYRARLEKLKDLGFTKAEISTLDGVGLTCGFERFGNHRMNITNSYSAEAGIALGLEGICLSAELNLPQIRDMKKPLNTEIVAYGRIPLMVTENCILKNLGKCKCDGGGSMEDRTGAEFPIIKDGDICRSVVLNSVPLYMGDKLSELQSVGADYLKMLFTTEDSELCRKICDRYFNTGGKPDFEYTRLHYLKGALA